VLFYEELLQALGVEHTYLVGHSYGGMLAAELAAHRPERVSRLVLLGSLGLWLDEAPVADFFVLTPSERGPILWHDPNSPAAQAYLARPEDPTARMEVDLDRTKTLSAIGKFIWPIPDRGLTKRVHRITMPTLLLWGDSDGIVPPVYGKAFQRLLPHATLKVLERCGHLPQLEHPEEFISVLRNFLTD
jgi:pimeloyl-ACP methyl ester carboxylesterase